jgi:hypothetical protein
MNEGVSESIKQAFYDSVYAESMKHFQANPKITELMQKIVEIELEKILDDLLNKRRPAGFRS